MVCEGCPPSGPSPASGVTCLTRQSHPLALTSYSLYSSEPHLPAPPNHSHGDILVALMLLAPDESPDTIPDLASTHHCQSPVQGARSGEASGGQEGTSSLSALH